MPPASLRSPPAGSLVFLKSRLRLYSARSPTASPGLVGLRAITLSPIPGAPHCGEAGTHRHGYVKAGRDLNRALLAKSRGYGSRTWRYAPIREWVDQKALGHAMCASYFFARLAGAALAREGARTFSAAAFGRLAAGLASSSAAGAAALPAPCLADSDFFSASTSETTLSP